jgi:tight adherence protein B
MDMSILIPVLAAFSTIAIGGTVVLIGGNQQKQVHLKAQRLIEQRLSRGNSNKSVNLTLKKQDLDSKLNMTLRAMPSITKLRERLDRTGKNISIRQYYAWVIITIVVAPLILHFLFGSKPLVALLLGIFLGLMIPHKVVCRWENKQMKKFILLLPDALELMVRGLKAGLPVTESINVIRAEIGEPVSGIFGEIAQSVKMGVNFEDALMRMAMKLKNNEFNFFVISITLQRETGGNLSEILENLSETIRARAMMKLKIKAITSEARMSAYIIGALPFFVICMLLFVSPNYIDPMFNDIRGNIMLGVAGSMFSFGMFMMFKMAKFEI